jgi:hypothetical protein
MTDQQTSQFISTLISVGVGATIGLLASFLLDYLKSRRTESRGRASILGEIRANLESAEKGNVSSLLWVDDVYKPNLDKLGCFSPARLQRIVRFYANVAQYRDRITRQYKEHLEQAERNREQGIQGDRGIYQGIVLMLAKEIETLGKEILGKE